VSGSGQADQTPRGTEGLQKAEVACEPFFLAPGALYRRDLKTSKSLEVRIFRASASIAHCRMVAPDLENPAGPIQPAELDRKPADRLSPARLGQQIELRLPFVRLARSIDWRSRR
jgi:hypothetical protein